MILGTELKLAEVLAKALMLIWLTHLAPGGADIGLSKAQGKHSYGNKSFHIMVVELQDAVMIEIRTPHPC